MPASDWAPQIEDVAALLRARTRTDAGVDVGTFNGDTRPLDTQVETLIGAAQAELIGLFGSAEINVPFRDVLKQLTTLSTALKIEMGYFPEQINTARSPYEVIYRQYRDLLTDMLKMKAQIVIDDGNPLTLDDTSPAWNFPRQPPVLGMRAQY